MGKTEIRTAGKVSFDKSATEQTNIHVSLAHYTIRTILNIDILRQE